MKVFLSLLTALCLCASAVPSLAAIDDQFDATCRITAGNSMGTGCVCGINAEYVAILTNAHVVSRTGNVVQCEFWSQGHQSGKLPGQVYACDASVDCAAVLVPVRSFGNRLPKSLLFATVAPRPGETVLSVGCPAGAWATAWKGHVTRYEAGQMYFVPAPQGGRSGSAVTNEAGQIVGLLRVRTMDNAEGGAVDLATLRKRLFTEMSANLTTFVPCAALAGCGPNGCGPDAPDGIRRPLFPLIKPAAPPAPANPWPTLPGPGPAPSIDLGPIADAIRAIPPPVVNLPPPPASPAGPDPATVNALSQITGTLNQHGQAIDQLRADVPKTIDAAIAASVKPVSDQVGTIATAVKPLVDLRAKLESDAEAGGLKGKLASQILEAGTGDEGLRKVLITAGIVLGLVLLIAIAIVHTLRTGKGPAGAIIDKLAAANPSNQALQDVRAQVDRLDARIAAAGQTLPNLATAGLAAATGGLPLAAAVAAQAVPDLAARLRDVEGRLQTLALNTPVPAVPAAVPAAVPGPVTPAA